MEQHPLESLMKTAMGNLNEMIDVNKIVGDAVETPDGTVIIPVTRIMLGFVAGGSSYEGESGQEKNQGNQVNGGSNPFGGGSGGGGISVQPVAFLIVGQGQVRLLPVHNSAMLDRLIDLAPNFLGALQGIAAGITRELGNQKSRENGGDSFNNNNNTNKP